MQSRGGSKGKRKEASWRSAAQQCRVYADGSFESTQRIWDSYIRQEDNRGKTLFWHGLPSRCEVASDLLRRLEEIHLLDKLQYLYMPVGDTQYRTTRGKGYAFLHFFDLEAVDDLLNRSEQGLHVSGRQDTSLTNAESQGISANLKQILSSPKVEAMKGHFFARMNGQLEKFSIHDILTAAQSNSADRHD